MISLCFFAACIVLVKSQHSIDKEELLNWCLKGNYHKTKPGPESVLNQKCKPWANHSCCTSDTEQGIHDSSLYNLNIDHCANFAQRPMSEKCRHHFLQDHCFYECEPNIGPWVQKVNRQIARERIFEAPLCASDCDSWWEACQEEYTCTSNWPRNLIFKKNGTLCPKGSKCATYKTIFSNATNFCESVWDHSWKVTPDTDACLRIWFSGENPNRRVAEYHVDKLLENFNANNFSVVISASYCSLLTTMLLGLLLHFKL